MFGTTVLFPYFDVVFSGLQCGLLVGKYSAEIPRFSTHNMLKLNMLTCPSLQILSLATRKGFQGNILPSTQKVLSLLRGNNISHLRYPSGTTKKHLHLAGSNHYSSVYMCTDSSVSNPPRVKVKQGKSHETVKELLDFFETSKHFSNTTDLVDILYKIARDVWHDEKQRKELQKLRGASLLGCNEFRDLLNYLNDSIATSDLDEKLVAKIVWSLDKIGETNHCLYKKFQKGKIVLFK